MQLFETSQLLVSLKNTVSWSPIMYIIYYENIKLKSFILNKARV